MDSTNGMAAANPEAAIERESVRIANLKAVAAKLDLSEQRVRNLVKESHLTTVTRTMAGDDELEELEYLIIPASSVQSYLDGVASGAIESRKRSANHTAFTVYIPNDQLDAVLAALASFGATAKLRNAAKADADSEPQADTEVEANTPSANAASTAESERRTRNTRVTNEAASV